MNLNSLNNLVSKKHKFTPTNLDFIFYTFWEKGIDYNQFNELPIPYILRMIYSEKYISDKQEEEMKKTK
jgi:hypothetical protein